MLIGFESLDGHVRAVECMQGIFETTRGTVRIYGFNEPTVDCVEPGVDKQIPPSDKSLDPEKEALSRSSIRANETMRVPPMA